MGQTSLSLKNVTQIGRAALSDQLETNLLSFFQWGLLGVGNFFNVTIPTSGVYGGNQHQLRLSEDPNYAQGSVFESFRKDWVWETGVSYVPSPISVSGVYVNGNFYPNGTTGTYAFSIDNPNGRVVFNNPIPAGSKVTAEYSYRLFNFTTADVPWWREFQTNSFRVDDSQFQNFGSGAWSVLAQNRIQLPAVIVEATPRTNRTPFEIGNYSAIVKQDVLFHIVTEARSDLKTMHDIITSQWQGRIPGFDKNAVLAANQFPLNGDGSLASGAMMYPALTLPAQQGGFFWRQIRFADVRSYDTNFRATAPLYMATVRATCEVDDL